MRATFYGVRGSCPCSSDAYRRYGGNTSSVLVSVEGEPPLLLDLGTGARELGSVLGRAARDAGVPLEANALLTHLHYDHILGLPFFLPLQDPGSRLDVYGPSQDTGRLSDVLSAAVKPPFFPIQMGEFRGDLRFHELDARSGPEVVELGPVTVRARAVPHKGHTLGFRVEADGRAIVYLPDHQAPADRRSVDEGVLELCEGADLLVHDAQFTDDEFAAMPDWGHSTVAYALHVAGSAGVRRLVLFHHDPSHTDRQLDRMVAHARRLAGAARVAEVSAAAERATIDLGRA
ncbi:MAG: MBL fold metallo-hydrolase [Actinomycetota bacterium]|nr:MBL fold metallo-hydrolase [Actinomycetota bacterium]